MTRKKWDSTTPLGWLGAPEGLRSANTTTCGLGGRK